MQRLPDRFERGVFVLSLDFELVWGSRDLYDPIEPLLEQARATRARVFGPLLDRLTSLGITATWATVGHLFLDGARYQQGRLHPDLVQPRHAWHPAPWLQDVPEGDERSHPEYYARSLVLRLKAAGQEIGSHSFTHPVFGDPGCSRQVADTDLAACVREAKALGIELRSFVFPRNVEGHLDLVARHGFKCWRGPSPDWYRSELLPKGVARVGHIAQVLAAAEPPTVMPTAGPHGLWNIPASASYLPSDGPRRAIPVGRRVDRAKAGLAAADRSGRIFHLWLHPINLAAHTEPMLKGLIEVLEGAARLRDQGRLDIVSMGGMVDRCNALRTPA